MIGVIADDLTGAAEVAGLALLSGLKTKVLTGEVHATDADVLVIATDMRSSTVDSASETSAEVTRALLDLGCGQIFKKTDSVMRGHIAAELQAQMQVEGKDRSLLVPANPSHARTIRDGIYYVDGVKLGETDFGQQFRNGANWSEVTSRLRQQGASSTWSINPGDPMPAPGIYVGNVETLDHVRRWAHTLDDKVIPAGGAEFFAAFLNERGFAAAAPPPPSTVARPGARTLFVCGSQYPPSRQAVESAIANGATAVLMPDALYHSATLNPAALEAWAHAVAAALELNSSVIVAVLQAPSEQSMSSNLIATSLGMLVSQVQALCSIDHLLIEGGATALAVVQHLGIDELVPSGSVAPGVTRLSVQGIEGMDITMKPGSYHWPAALWSFGQANST